MTDFVVDGLKQTSSNRSQGSKKFDPEASMSPEILLLTLIYRSFCSCLPNMGVMVFFRFLIEDDPHFRNVW